MPDSSPELPDFSYDKLGGGKKSKKRQANEREQNLAKKHGWRRQPNSGATDAHKGDFKLRNFLLDGKDSTGNSIIISGNDLTKITREADGEGKVPGLVLTLNRLPYSVSSEWVMIPLEVFSELLDES